MNNRIDDWTKLLRLTAEGLEGAEARRRSGPRDVMTKWARPPRWRGGRRATTVDSDAGEHIGRIQDRGRVTGSSNPPPRAAREAGVVPARAPGGLVEALSRASSRPMCRRRRACRSARPGVLGGTQYPDPRRSRVQPTPIRRPRAPVPRSSVGGEDSAAARYVVAELGGFRSCEGGPSEPRPGYDALLAAGAPSAPMWRRRRMSRDAVAGFAPATFTPRDGDQQAAP